ncbi:TetR/AcrR family transcriptional regulator [Mycobacterium sp. MYCO198283]|uniref:TetR/AcrR family transcriptional regulator n=1 Tax=Mycobacterium sp. MYCO198283 TaxID=2883505 RepID=UPI001E42DFB8|nr:TetR/AcrR family transcriptional regulator [Mycobacterium sp. MYCO198283]MCG5432219.1 TetR/AcrR family transcriptional regulator [Mycobacterium sp. MYCO198283]
MTSLRDDADAPIDTRQRLLDVAIRLISRHGCAGTSLQMIADELGFTKAAIYYHFRTRDELLVALMQPILGQIRHAVEAAEGEPTPRAQMECMVRGYAEVVAANRSLAAVMVFDSSVRRILQMQEEWGDLIERQLAILMQLEPDATGFLKATTLFSGLAGAATGAPPEVDLPELIEDLAMIGRRIVGLRAPRRSPQATRRVEEQRKPEPLPRRWKEVLAERSGLPQ